MYLKIDTEVERFKLVFKGWFLSLFLMDGWMDGRIDGSVRPFTHSCVNLLKHWFVLSFETNYMTFCFS